MSHYKSYREKKLYKNSRRGKICGIFSGLGDYMGMNPLFLRLAGILSVIFFGPVVILGYLLVSLLLDDKPFDY